MFRSNELFNAWLYGPTSTDPKDYYYKVDKRGRKFYFNRWKAKNNKISKEFLKERGVNIDEIAEYSVAPTTQEEASASKEREEAYRARIREKWRRLFDESDKPKSTSTKKNPSGGSSRSSENPSSRHNDSESVLQKLNIHTKKEWREWLRRNHPDKLSTADVELCARVIEEGQRVFM